MFACLLRLLAPGLHKAAIHLPLGMCWSALQALATAPPVATRRHSLTLDALDMDELQDSPQQAMPHQRQLTSLSLMARTLCTAGSSKPSAQSSWAAAAVLRKRLSSPLLLTVCLVPRRETLCRLAALDWLVVATAQSVLETIVLHVTFCALSLAGGSTLYWLP